MRKYLFVVSGQFHEIGGHLISAATIASCLARRNHKVGMLVAPFSFELPELDHAIRMHRCIYSTRRRSYISRPLDIYRVIRKHGYNTIVAMDWIAAFEAAPVAALLDLDMVQIQPGGKVQDIPFQWLPGLMVFSQELLTGLPSINQNISSSDLVFFPGRVDFESFAVGPVKREHALLGFNSASPRVLAISRLHHSKERSLLALLEQVRDYTQSMPLQLFVIGDGKIRSRIEREAQAIASANMGKATIRFLGNLRVTPTLLREADLVVGQGRTVIEAIAAGVPVSVCGNDGYFGLVTSENFPLLSLTNFTGRNVQPTTRMCADLDRLEWFRQKEQDNLYRMALELYDVSLNIQSIEQALTLNNQHFSSRRQKSLNLMKRYVHTWAKITSFAWKRLVCLLPKYRHRDCLAQ